MDVKEEKKMKKMKVKRDKENGSIKSLKDKKSKRRRAEEDVEGVAEQVHKKARIDGVANGQEHSTNVEHLNVPPASENGSATTPRKKGKKRRRHTEEDLANLPEEERLRREEQKALRLQAIQMRAEGKAYKRPKKRQATESGKKAIATAEGRIQNQPKYADAEEGSRPDSPVQVIVVPIFWNRKPDEKASVIEASARIVKLLQDAGLTSGMDTTTAMSPGQKFAYWEKEGVKVRIECGPKDAAQGSCVLAITKSPGQVADKHSLKVGAGIAMEAGKVLGIQVKAAAPVLVTDQDSVEDAAMEPEVTRKRPARAAPNSGDDLGGDFGDINLLDDQPKKKKKSK